MNLRPHQQTAFDDIRLALKHNYFVLLEAACSAGKTIIFSKLIQRLLKKNPKARVLVLTDREILVTQTQDKLNIVAPELMLDIGIVCAGISSKKELEKRVTIASRQTLINQLDKFEPVTLIIVDECHLIAVPKIGQVEPSDQFGTIIERLREYNPKVRILGVTATPYRLGDGYIYGEKNKPGSAPYFEELHHKITTRELLEDKWIAPLIGKVAMENGIEKELDKVGLVAGEYNLGALSGLMTRSVHLHGAVDIWKENAIDRNKTIAYCVTIDHAEKLKECFEEAGISALTVHSQLNEMDDYIASQELKDPDSKTKVFCSVAKLTTGMDVPSIDCLLMVRATKSTSLYKQILGRGQRLFPGKENCLVLDLVGNSNEFGTNLDKLHVKYQIPTDSDGNRLINKECPDCAAELHPAVRVCPECDYEYPAEEFNDAGKPDMVDVEFGEKPPVTLGVEFMFGELHESKKSGKILLKLRLELESEEDSYKNHKVYLWLCFPDDGYGPYPSEKGRKMWKELGGNDNFPESAEEALKRVETELCPPTEVKVDLNGRYPELIEMIAVPF